MLLATRKVLLDRLMRLHDRLGASAQVACRKGCAACCTDKVVVTTLEGLAIFEFLERLGPADWRPRLRSALAQERFRPQTTINAWAEQCLKDEEAEEVVEPLSVQGVCPFLTAEACPLYAVRPLACRAMLSRTACTQGGAADMPEPDLALNTVFLQYLEAIDRPGLSGNLIDILAFMADPQRRRSYLAGAIDAVPQGLLANRALPALMVPPEWRDRVRPAIEAIQAAIRRPDI